MTATSKDSIHQTPEHFGSKAVKWLNPLTWAKVIIQAWVGAIVLSRLNTDN